MDDVTIRLETAADYRVVEELTREAFWNLYVPGADEHYLAHRLRTHPDFVGKLDFVLTVDEKVVANIMYSRALLHGDEGKEKDVLTFGPVSVHPDHQRKGLGSRLIQHSLDRAKDLGWKAVAIYGTPGNYVKFGFKSCKRFNVTSGDGVFPTALLVLELASGYLGAGPWRFAESEVFQTDPDEVKEFDKAFPAKRKEVQPSQEEFFILSHSTIT